jgi:hypothetical protein
MGYTKEDLQQARQTDMLSYLQGQNELAIEKGEVPPYRIEREGDQFRLKDHGGLLFKNNFFNQRNSGIGGNTLEFLVQIEGKSFKEAMGLLIGKEANLNLNRVEPSQIQAEKVTKPFNMPERNDTFRRAIAYLTKTRGLDAKMVLDEIKAGNIFEDKEHHNVVFLGKNEFEEPMWAQKRSTLTMGKRFVAEAEGSNPRHTYTYGNKKAKTVVVVEAPIEALSLANLMMMKNKDISNLCFLTLGGVHDTALQQYLKDNPNCKGIVTALNNDKAEKPNEIKGREASAIIRDKYSKAGYSVGSIFPLSNDWNDDLRAVRKDLNDKGKEIQREDDVEREIKDYAKMKKKQKTLERTTVAAR